MNPVHVSAINILLHALQVTPHVLPDLIALVRENWDNPLVSTARTALNDLHHVISEIEQSRTVVAPVQSVG